MKKTVISISVIVMLSLTIIATFAISEMSNSVKTDVPQELTYSENTVYKKLSESKKKGEMVQEDIEYYTYFISVLEPSKDERKYIEKLIDKGYNVQALVKIFDFWRYTNEDIKIIEKAYEYKPYDLNISYWVDDAFIRLYENGESTTQYSNLSVEEVEKYKSQGITSDEIRAADKMSRKGVKTIETILAERIDGKSWCEIADDIYNIELTPSELEQLKSIKDPLEIIESVKLSKRTKEKVKDALKDSLNGEGSFKKNNEFKLKKMNDAKEILKKQKLWDDSKKETKRKAIFREEDLF